MKMQMMTVALAAALAGLSACNKQAETPAADAPKAAVASDAMSDMAMPAGAKMGAASGTVVAIDPAGGKITLDHSAIPAVGWPAMKMGFAAKPGVLAGISVGDKVDFDVTVSGSAAEVTSIKKR